MILFLLFIEHIVLSYYVNVSCVRTLFNRNGKDALDDYITDKGLGWYILISPVTVYLTVFELLCDLIERPDFINGIPNSLGFDKDDEKKTAPRSRR